MRGLEGRTYIVTGAASGIGRATASRLLDEGASVMGADLADEPAAAPGAVAEGARWALHRPVTRAFLYLLPGRSRALER